MIDVEKLIYDCIPGGDVCDPQVVADNIREWMPQTTALTAQSYQAVLMEAQRDVHQPREEPAAQVAGLTEAKVLHLASRYGIGTMPVLRGSFAATMDETERLMAFARALLAAPAAGTAQDKRRFRGVGHLESTGYIPEGSAAEREAATGAQGLTDAQVDRMLQRFGQSQYRSGYAQGWHDAKDGKPQAAPSAAVPELSSATIEQGWRDTFSTNNPYCPCDLKSFTKAVRWTEHALTDLTK